MRLFGLEIKRVEKALTPVADWRGGQTPHFSWPMTSSTAGGYSVLRAPTTVNGPGASTTYLYDFTIARSLQSLSN